MKHYRIVSVIDNETGKTIEYYIQKMTFFGGWCIYDMSDDYNEIVEKYNKLVYPKKEIPKYSYVVCKTTVDNTKSQYQIADLNEGSLTLFDKIKKMTLH